MGDNMILEIATGVCIGIVVAAVILKNWKALLGGSIWILTLCFLMALLFAVATFFWRRGSQLLIDVGAILGLLVLYGIPFAIYHHFERKYHGVRALLKGEAPWNKGPRIAGRLLLMMVIALTLAGIGIGGLLGGVALVDLLSGSESR